MTVKIVVDSTTDTLPEIGQRLFQVPLSIHFGADTYRDGEKDFIYFYFPGFYAHIHTHLNSCALRES